MSEPSATEKSSGTLFQSVNWFYGTVFLGSIGVIVYGNWIDSSVWPIASVLLKDLGGAGLIAIILVYTVERVTRERHEKAALKLQKQINTDLFRAIFQRYIPASVFQEVEKCLFKTDVLRTNYSVDYSLDFMTAEGKTSTLENSKYLRGNIFSKYRLVNGCRRGTYQSIEMHLELPIDNALRRFCSIGRVTIGGVPISADVLSEHITETENHLILCYKTQIPAGGFVDISIGSTTVKQKMDMEVWASRLPSTGLTLRVTAPKSIKVHATANHSERLRQSQLMDGKVSIWELDHGIFPFQSVIFWWNVE